MNKVNDQNVNPDELIFSDKILYECIKCGNCCNDFWEIPIDINSLEILKNEKDHQHIPIPHKQTDLFYKSKYLPEGWCIKAKEGNCSYIDLQKICLIHKHLGYDKKPQICKDFPFKYLKTPGGIYVSPSFSCYSILKNIGNPLSSYKDTLITEFKTSTQIYEIMTPIKLSERLEIPFDIYLKIEKGLIDFLNADVYSLDDRLVGGNVFLNLLEEFILQAVNDPNYTLDIIVDTFIDSIQKQNYARIIKIAQKPMFSNSLHRMFIRLLISFRNNPILNRGTFSTLTKILWNYLMGGIKYGKITLFPLQNRFTFNDFITARFIKEEPYFVYLIHRYVTHLLETKQAILRTSLIKGYNFILLYSAIIRWYCVGLISERYEPDINREDINKAVEWTDKYYGFTSWLFNIINEYPVISDTINRFFDRKQYASSIIRGGKH